MTAEPPRLDRVLAESEVLALHGRCYPMLVDLAARYAPDVDIAAGFPDDPMFLDLLRTGWLVDNGAGRLATAELVDALGYAFGLLLAQIYGLRWCALRDADGEFLALLGADGVTVPPFAWVAARAELKVGDVFGDFVLQVAPGMFAEDDG